MTILNLFHVNLLSVEFDLCVMRLDLLDDHCLHVVIVAELVLRLGHEIDKVCFEFNIFSLCLLCALFDFLNLLE